MQLVLQKTERKIIKIVVMNKLFVKKRMTVINNITTSDLICCFFLLAYLNGLHFSVIFV